MVPLSSSSEPAPYGFKKDVSSSSQIVGYGAVQDGDKKPISPNTEAVSNPKIRQFQSRIMNRLFAKNKSLSINSQTKYTFQAKLGFGHYKTAVKVSKIKTKINELGNQVGKLKEKALLITHSQDASFQKTDADFQNEIAINQKLKGIADEAKKNGKSVLKHVAIAKPIEYKGEIALSTNVMKGGTVLSNLKTATPPQLMRMVKGMINGVKELHELGIKHRDIKTDNFLLDEEGNVKICDMGKAYSDDNVGAYTLLVVAYVAPGASSTKWSEKADIYQLGIVIFQTLLKVSSFNESKQRMAPDLPAEKLNDEYAFEHSRDMHAANGTWAGMETLDPATRNMLMRMLSADPYLRPSIEEVAKFFDA